ncbi:MAG: gliding motility-associated C-terminal domain-containing protein [Crocinitomicaceae bacterium]
MRYSFLFFFCLVYVSAFGQNGTTVIGSTLSNEYGSCITMNTAGDLFIGGTHQNDAMITKLNSNGEVIWANSYQFTNHPDYVTEIGITSDNYIIGCGTSRTTSNNNPNGFIFKMDTAGSIIWKRITNCSNTYMWELGVIEANNGNYQTCGSQNTNNGHQDNYIAEFDSNTGAKVWDSVYAISTIGNGLDEVFYSIDKNPLNGASYMAGRFHSPAGQMNYHPSITKINPDGSLDWSKTYIHAFSSNGGRLYGVGLDFDGDSIIGLISGRFGSTGVPFELGMYKTDSSGIMSWGKKYTSSTGQDLRTYHIESVPSGYVVSGYINNGNKNLFILKTDKLGNVLWSNSYGSVASEDIYIPGANHSSLVNGNELLLVGRTNGFFGAEDIVLFRIDLTTGNLINGIGCTSPFSVNTSNIPTFQQNYPLVSAGLLMTTSDPVVSTSAINFNQSGQLVEAITDTIVSGDTLFLCQNDVVNVEADWNSNYTYSWNTGNNLQSQTITNTGWYTVSVSSSGCTIFTDSVYALVTGVTLDLGMDTSLCDVASFALDATTPNATYLWSDGSTGPMLTVSNSGAFWVEVSNAGCTVIDSINITMGTSPIVDLGNDSTLCAGNSLVLDAQNAGMTYSWQDGSANQTFTVVQSGQYFVEVADGICTNSDTVNVIFIPLPTVNLGNDTVICGNVNLLLDAGFVGGTYLWQDGSTLPTFNVNAAGVYAVEVGSGGCTSVDSIVVLNPPIPVVDLGNDSTFCDEGIPFILDAQNTGAVYAWQDGSTNQFFSVTNSGQFFVEVSVGNCSDSDTVNIVMLTPPTINLGNDTTVCDGQALTLDVTSPNVSYLWQDGSMSPTYSASNSGTYFVTLDNGFCTATDSIDIVFGSDPLVDLGNDTSFCSNGTLILDVLTLNASYSWSTGSSSPSIDVVQAGTYWVTVDVDGCVNSDSVIVSMTNPPSIDQANIELCQDESEFISFTQETGLSYVWQDGSIASSYTIDQPGNFEVIAINQCGSDTAQFSSILKNCYCELFVPNAFTPNSSNLNETFGAVAGCPLAKFELAVYNRWGEIIFETNDISIQWDATYLGKIVPDGMYSWKVLYQFSDLVEDQMTGHVVVIR